MEIKTEKQAWIIISQAQEVFKPIFDFRLKLSISAENIIEISTSSGFKIWEKGDTKPLIFKGNNTVDTVNNFFRFFKNGKTAYIKKHNERIDFLGLLSFKKNKWCLEKIKLNFNFFKKDGSLHSSLRPYPKK